MSTTAVTPAAPAAANTAASTANESNSEFLPTDRTYRMTGNMPEETASGEDKTSSEKPAAGTEEQQDKTEAAAQDEQASDDAAASEAASAQDKTKGKTAATSESRWAKLSRVNREQAQTIDSLNRRLSALEQPPASRDASQNSQTAAADTTRKPLGRPEPKIDEVDPATKKPKYATYEEFTRDQRAWDREQVKLEMQEANKQTETQRQAADAERIVKEGFVKKITPAREKYADFDEVALGEHLLIPKGSAVDIFLLDSDHAGEVLYHLGQHPEITQGFYENFDSKTGRFTNKVPPTRQFRELVKLEEKLTSGSAATATAGSTPAKKITAAPPPPRQVSGNGSSAKDPIEAAVEAGDTAAYMREANRRELAERRKGK